MVINPYLINSCTEHRIKNASDKQAQRYRKAYIKSYYKTLGENPEQFKSTVKETEYRARNLIFKQDYSHFLYIYIVFL